MIQVGASFELKTKVTEQNTATPVGMEVRAVATITEVDGKKVKFAIEAYDEAGLIGKGDHLRIIVTRDRFLQGAADKLQK